MFSFTRDGEPLKGVQGANSRYSTSPGEAQAVGAVVQTAKPIVYLPFTAGTLIPSSSAARVRWPPPARRWKNCGPRKYPAPPLRANCSPTPFRWRCHHLAVIEQTDDRLHR
jgi:hypothetical protein